MNGITILTGDCRETLKTIPDKSVHCCVTSPPYFGLRDYGCDGQIGLEETPEQYVAELVAVFREVWRVLRDDGTLWLNLGDTYASSGIVDPGSHKGLSAASERCDGRPRNSANKTNENGSVGAVRKHMPHGLKPKDLIGIPWRVAFALQSDGWYLRQDIIWHKPNPMPESVTDRCTKAHEYLFLLTKSQRYFFDAKAIQEPSVESRPSGNKHRKPASERGVPVDSNGSTNGAVAGSVPWEGNERNKRSVWTVSTKPYSGAHFATFPPDLIAPCIRAGCPEGGTVLDPFNGSGTTGEVARKFGCLYIGCELNPVYVNLTKKRLQQGSLFVQ